MGFRDRLSARRKGSSEPEAASLADRILAPFDAGPWLEARDIRGSVHWPDVEALPAEGRLAVALDALRHSAEAGRGRRRAADLLATACLAKAMPMDDAGRVALLRGLLATVDDPARPLLSPGWDASPAVVRALERGGEHTVQSDERELLQAMKAAFARQENAEGSRYTQRAAALLGDGPADGVLHGKDPWTWALLSALAALPGPQREAGRAALGHAGTVRGAKATKAYLQGASALAESHATEDLSGAVTGLLRASALAPSAERGQVPSALGDTVRGLCFIAATLPPGEELAAAVAGWVTAGWAKVPGYGPASKKAAGGAGWALGRLGDPGAAQLGRVRSKLRQPQAVKQLDAVIDDAAEALGIPRAEFEERVVPTLGLGPGATFERVLGEHSVRLSYAGEQVRLGYATLDGAARKTAPAALRREHGDELKALKALAKDATEMIAAQRIRLERLLLEERVWELATWRERYLDHPLVSVLAQRLIWRIDGQPVLFEGGELRDLHGVAVSPDPRTEVSLWHPVSAGTEEVRAWRSRIEAAGIAQPFKQAHREVYLLTDAERTTGSYSNRFAGHILRQHQFAALARGRGWHYALQGAWDSADELATLALPARGLRAEFWVDRPWDAEEDWSDAGVFNHVLTDQVRFFATATLDGEPLPIDSVPALVLSEVLRDVDLFVGVTSIGNDPTWQDGGGRPAWFAYWQGASFGELGAAAEIRRDLLERLLPKLALAEVASLEGRFLRIRGTRREYRIHLGSGNVLMSPDDQYLCIVPDRGQGRSDGVMLPFEGDRMLSIVLSKAMLLARDDEIEDTTILSQLARR